MRVDHEVGEHRLVAVHPHGGDVHAGIDGNTERGRGPPRGGARRPARASAAPRDDPLFERGARSHPVHKREAGFVAETRGAILEMLRRQRLADRIEAVARAAPP